VQISEDPYREEKRRSVHWNRHFVQGVPSPDLFPHICEEIDQTDHCEHEEIPFAIQEFPHSLSVGWTAGIFRGFSSGVKLNLMPSNVPATV
jgi:hypothetical protein